MSSSANPTSTKERHYAHLSARLETLSRNFQNTQLHFNLMSDQAKYVRKLGASQAALFMSALNQVDKDANAQESQDQEEQDQQEQHQREKSQ